MSDSFFKIAFTCAIKFILCSGALVGVGVLSYLLANDFPLVSGFFYTHFYWLWMLLSVGGDFWGAVTVYVSLILVMAWCIYLYACLPRGKFKKEESYLQLVFWACMALLPLTSVALEFTYNDHRDLPQEQGFLALFLNVMSFVAFFIIVLVGLQNLNGRNKK